MNSGDGAPPAAGRFERYDHADVRALVAAYPLAWVCARGGGVDEASLLPLIGEYDADGRLLSLIGHLARANPLVAALGRDSAALILFKGPDGYVSPEHAGARDWAPTWNYAQLRVEAAVAFDDALTEPSLDVLIAAMEAGGDRPWTPAEIGDRYARLRRAIIGFRARVTRVAGRFKLGQDERADVRGAIIDRHPDAALAAWMRRFDRH